MVVPLKARVAVLSTGFASAAASALRTPPARATGTGAPGAVVVEVVVFWRGRRGLRWLVGRASVRGRRGRRGRREVMRCILGFGFFFGWVVWILGLEERNVRSTGKGRKE